MEFLHIFVSKMSQIKCAIKLNMFIYLKLEIQFLWKNIKAGESKEKQKKPSFALLYSQSWLGETVVIMLTRSTLWSLIEFLLKFHIFVSYFSWN